MPGQQGRFNPLLVAVAMIGAVGGSLMNLAYPYFLEAKGWRGPQYRKVQFYDLLLAVIAMIVLNLACGRWAPSCSTRQADRELDDLPRLLSAVLGEGGRWLFYVGIFAAIYTSVLGHAAGLAYMGTHAWLRWRAGSGADHDRLPRRTRCTAGSWSGAWCRRWSGRSPACRTSSR